MDLWHLAPHGSAYFKADSYVGVLLKMLREVDVVSYPLSNNGHFYPREQHGSRDAATVS